MVISIKGALKHSPSVYSTLLYKTCVHFTKIMIIVTVNQPHSKRMFFTKSTHSICLVGLYILLTIADT